MTRPPVRDLPLKDYVDLSNHLCAWVRRRFERSGRTEWPTVRDVAQALKLRQWEVTMLVNDDSRLMITYYLVDWNPLEGDHFVELLQWDESSDAEEEK